MKLINTDGMAFIGPGSEWFWTALSGLVLAVTFIAIYRQLRAQRSATAFDQMVALDRDYDDVRFLRERLVLLLDLEGREVNDGLPESAFPLLNWYDRLGMLVAQGHLKSFDVWHAFGTDIEKWWADIGPYVQRQRVIIGFPIAYGWFESLAREMERLDVRLLGKPYVEPITSAQRIDIYTARLQRAQDAAHGIIPMRKVVPTPTPPRHP